VPPEVEQARISQYLSNLNESNETNTSNESNASNETNETNQSNESNQSEETLNESESQSESQSISQESPLETQSESPAETISEESQQETTSEPEPPSEFEPEPEPEQEPEQESSIPQPLPPHLVISEIKIAGVDDTKDEFVELYNPFPQPISLANFKLRPFTASGNEKSYLLRPFPENAIIPAFGFYLIAHPEGYRHNITPDALYSTKESLANSNGLILYNQNNEIVDIVGWGELSTSTIYETTPAPEIPKGFSLERKANLNSTYETMKINGEDEILGNSFDTDNNFNDFILRPDPDPQNSQSLPEPRQGDFVAPKDVDDLIPVYSKFRPTSVTLAFSAPKNANLLNSSSEISSTNTPRYDVRYLKTIIPGLCLINLEWFMANQANSEIIPNPIPRLKEEITISTLEPNTEYCFALKTFNGFAWSGISNTVIVKTPKEFKVNANGNLENITIIPPYVTSELILTPDNNPYYVNSFVEIKENGKLIIQPGVVIKFDKPYQAGFYKFATEIFVNGGSLEILGNPQNPVILTSIKDDRILGDTNGDGDASLPQNTDWGGIRTSVGEEKQKITISYANIYFSNEALRLITNFYPCDNPPQISLDHLRLQNNFQTIRLVGLFPGCDAPPVKISNILVENNFSGLILSKGARAEIYNSTFRYNDNYGIYLEAVFSDQLKIRQSNLYGNNKYDLWNFCGVDLKEMVGSSQCIDGKEYPKYVDAQENWWGSDKGPNSSKVNGRINYTDWLKEEVDIGL